MRYLIGVLNLMLLLVTLLGIAVQLPVMLRQAFKKGKESG